MKWPDRHRHHLQRACKSWFDMNILHITNHSKDVSGRIAYELHQGFKKHGHNSHILFKRNCGNYPDDDVAQIRCGFPAFYHRLNRKAKQLVGISDKIPSDPNYHFYNQYENRTLFSTKSILKNVPFVPGIIILYWVSNTINSRNIYELNSLTKAPVLWYMMDMASLTGGCHYAWDCEGYKKSCGKCPAIYSSDEKDITYRNLLLKKKHFDQANLFVVAGTEWLYRQAKESTLFREKPVYKVMASKEPEIFRPFDKQLSRRKLRVPFNKKVVFFGATTFDQKRKGLSYLLDALQKLKHLLHTSDQKDKVMLLIAGRHNKDLFDKLSFDYTYTGMLSYQDLALAYQASDVFVCPSIEDSGPLMINESIMCGTPVVSFEMGVAPDLVHTGKTGYRAKLKNSEDLARGIYNTLSLDDAEYSQMCRSCRELGLKLLSPSVQVRAFEEVFESVRAYSR